MRKAVTIIIATVLAVGAIVSDITAPAEPTGNHYCKTAIVTEATGDKLVLSDTSSADEWIYYNGHIAQGNLVTIKFADMQTPNDASDDVIINVMQRAQ